jgi:DNA-directed RNA polymerase subunit L
VARHGVERHLLTARKDDAQSNVYQILRKGLDDLSDLCDTVEEKFTEARDEFNAQNPDRENS